MSSNKEKAIALLEIEENLRQKRETFDQLQRHDARWFTLRLTMGYMAAIVLSIVAIAMGFIMFYHGWFPPSLVDWAGRVLFAAVVGISITAWKIVHNPRSVERLKPVTSAEPSPEETE